MQTNIAERILTETNDLSGARDLVDIEGLSSPRVCNLLNRLVAGMAPGEHYLEIGTWKGRTLLSAAHGNAGRLCIACDKFRFWGKFTGPGFLARRALLRNVARHRAGAAQVEFHAMTSRELFRRELVRAPIGVFFYDGDHSYAETRHAVMSVEPYLSQRSVLVIDDWADPIIVRATHDALRAARLDVLWHRSLPGNHDEEGFWNGLGVFYIERHRPSDARTPAVLESKSEWTSTSPAWTGTSPARTVAGGAEQSLQPSVVVR